MGKVRTRKVKVLAKEIFELSRGEVTTDFEGNKRLVAAMLAGSASKKLRNRVAGYLTALAKQAAKREASAARTQETSERGVAEVEGSENV